jgi:glycosyltransferase involved in cell wall biosynthesis
MKIAFLSTYDSLDINNWSGSPFYIAKTLNEHFSDISFIGKLKGKTFLINILRKLYFSKINRKIFYEERTEQVLRYYAKQIEAKLACSNFDLIISIGVLPIAFLKTNIPIITIADANFNAMVNYYMKHLCKFSINSGNNIELRGFNNSKFIVFASDWAAETAIDFYKICKDKVNVIPFGANLDNIPTIDKLKNSISNPFEILFIGKEWERKGGSVALETFLQLNRLGIDTNLTIIGSIPPNPISSPKLKIYPFLNKNNEIDRAKFNSIMLNTDIFLMPSKEECYGIVFCESNAYGIPCFSTVTGGIPTIIKDGINGFLFPITADANVYTQKILEIINDDKSFIKLRKNSRQRYDELLNWNAFGTSLSNLINLI